MSDNTVLQAKNLSRSYKQGDLSVDVLSNVNLDVASGERIAIIGSSGSGKSTLLHLLGGLDTPSAGSVTVDGQNFADLSQAKKGKLRNKHVGFVYQFHHLLPEFSALENVVLPQLANGVSSDAAQRRASELLTRVGLEGRMHHRPAELSGGEQQRVAFCRAMANGPQLLLADEPTGNLDPDTADRMFATLMEMTRETGLSALIATHNHELAARMDRVVRLEHGVLV